MCLSHQCAKSISPNDRSMRGMTMENVQLKGLSCHPYSLKPAERIKLDIYRFRRRTQVKDANNRPN